MARADIHAHALERTAELLADRYGEAGEAATSQLRRWLSGELPYTYPEVIERHLDDNQLPLVFDAFWQVLPFGTGGRRGPVGYGPNRMNPTTVAMTVQGHCNYLRARFGPDADLSVVVANDVRVFNDFAATYRFLEGDNPLIGVSSRSLARLACEIYAGNGIAAWMAEPEDDGGVMTTPTLAFLIAHLGAAGGVNLSASHNPPDDNGIKIYDELGGQPVAPDDQHLVDAMSRAAATASLAFPEALAAGMVRAVAPEAQAAYLATYTRLFAGQPAPRADVPVVYTPLCGTGLTSAGALLGELGFPVLTPPAEGPDGTFGPIPYRVPNPEVPDATEPARAFAEANGSSIVLSSDPDADRVGVEARLADGSWHHFDGNQIATILAWHLMVDRDGPRRQGLVIETVVTTRLLGRIVAEAGGSYLVDDLLVGFKYVAEVLKRLDREGHYRGIACSSADLVLAAEESHGIMVAPTIRDKDSAPACMYLASLHQELAARGQTLLDYYLGILERLGPSVDVNRSVMMAGAGGVRRRDQLMASLRNDPPTSLAGSPVQKVVDHWDPDAFGPFVSDSDRLPRNVLQISTEQAVVTVRPSGTEPKAKFYCQVFPQVGSSLTGAALLAEATAAAQQVATRVYGELLERLDVSLSPAGFLLPDIIDLDRKVRFDREVLPALREALATARFSSVDDLLGWLGQEVAFLLPGTDPLPAAKRAVAHMLGEWRGDFSPGPVLNGLAAWAG